MEFMRYANCDSVYRGVSTQLNLSAKLFPRTTTAEAPSYDDATIIETRMNLSPGHFSFLVFPSLRGGGQGGEGEVNL